MLIGAHVSPAGGLRRAVERGVERGCRSIQIFNQSPRMWRASTYADQDVAAFRRAMDESPIDAVLIHAVYLLNCASEDPDIRAKSLASLTNSLRAGQQIGAAGVVLHPGSAKKTDPAAAIARAGECIARRWPRARAARCTSRTPPARAGRWGGPSTSSQACSMHAAATAGSGSCLDSCHLFASGYDIRTRRGVDGVLSESARRSAGGAWAHCT